MTAKATAAETGPATLYAYRVENATLHGAMARYGKLLGSDALGLLYSPDRCIFARLAAGKICDRGGHPVPLDRVFEARLFNAAAELRWLQEPGGAGTAVLLTEVQNLVLNENPTETLSALDRIPQNYVLWGEGLAALGSGWCRLAEARIGGFDVPVNCTPKQRARLLAREYVCDVPGDDHGNVAVLEERLLGLEVM